jgi:hypothetical protein
MRTYVRMGPRPWKPAIELEGALDRGELRYAITLAAEVTHDRRRPIDLQIALRFLPLIAAERAELYDARALRWLVRWTTETPNASIDRAAELACSLADARTEPHALDSIRHGLA